MEKSQIITEPLPVKAAVCQLIFLRVLQLIDRHEKGSKWRWRDIQWLTKLYLAHVKAEQPTTVVNNNRLEIRCTNKELDAIFERELVRRGRVIDMPKPGNGNGNGNGKQLGPHPPGLHGQAGADAGAGSDPD